MLRIHRNMFWDHLTLANIGNSIFDLQISTLGTTIGPQNLPFRPGISQETFWFLRIDYRLSIIDYWLSIIDHRLSIIDYWLSTNISQHSSLCFLAKPPAGSFRKKHFLLFFTKHENCKNWFFEWFCVPIIFVFHYNHWFFPNQRRHFDSHPCIGMAPI